MDISNAECPTQDVLLDYAAGRLSSAQSALFERHAESCASCFALRAAQTALWQDLDEWKPAPVSVGFNRELWRRIDSDAGGGVRWSFWKLAAPLAVAMAVMVAAFVFDHSPDRRRQAARSAPAVVVTAGDAAQLERALDDIQLLHEVDAEAAAVKPPSGLM